MAIYMDKPTREGWAHLLSDLPGRPGQEELFSFARDAFLPRRRHRSGSYAEHIDIRGPEIGRALAAGAHPVSRRQLARILKTKRHIEGPALPGHRHYNRAASPGSKLPIHDRSEVKGSLAGGPGL